MDWEMLPGDLWSLIGSKLDGAADRVRFRAVCKTWMSLLPPILPSIWLMIPQYLQEEEHAVPSPRPGFVIAGEEQIYHFHLPEDYHNRRCVGSTGTSLVTVDLDGNIRVFDLFSRVETSLPPQATFIERRELPPELARDSFIGKIVLSSSDIYHGDCFAVAIHQIHNKLAIARPGHASWILLDSDMVDVLDLEDIIFFKGKFYGIESRGLIMVIDIGDRLDSCEVTDFINKYVELDPLLYPKKKYYLVEWMGELVLVMRLLVYPPVSIAEEDVDQPAVYSTGSFKLYKVDLQNNKYQYQNNWVELKSLGEYSLFLGLNTSVSVRACDYNGSLKKNCIYFTDYFAHASFVGYQSRSTRRGQLDMGVYDLESGSIQPCYRDMVFPSSAAPIWIVPTPPSALRATEQGSSTTHT